MYGFYEEISRKYGNHNVWYLFNEVFDFLPLGAIVEGNKFLIQVKYSVYMEVYLQKWIQSIKFDPYKGMLKSQRQARYVIWCGQILRK